ncbi:hypothetical protein BN1002_03779 [Bacillus sp. B-jedd]|nr:hypothetical protein BN1002_03779 [Bacillus sp. B-jedd]
MARQQVGRVDEGATIVLNSRTRMLVPNMYAIVVNNRNECKSPGASKHT